MIFINHRINTIEQLLKVPKQNGIEIDVRYHNNDLILHHDPFSHHLNNVVTLEELLKIYNLEGPLILNVKTEGIEEQCIHFMNKYNIKNWFFLDLSMPYFVIYSNKFINNNITGFSSNNLAVRFSEYEPIEYALSFANKVKWVWVDCFHNMPLNYNNYKLLKQAQFKICLVSPELQKHSMSRIDEFKEILKNANIIIDAVCTKRPDLWGQSLPVEVQKQLEEDYPKQ